MAFYLEDFEEMITFAPDDESWKGWWLFIGCSSKQFIAERGIEYGLQFVTRFFFNSPDCLYLKKSCKFLQRYEKSRAEQKILIFFMPRQSKFAISDGKVT